MAEPIDRPWNHERDAKREQVARQAKAKKEKENKRYWIFAIVIFVVMMGAYIIAEVTGAGGSACDETRTAYSRWQITDSSADYDAYRAAMARCAAEGYE